MSGRLVRGLVATALLSGVAVSAAALTLDAVADTYVNSDMPTMNFGSFSFAEVGVLAPPKNSVERALLTFDLSGVPPAAQITRARLQFVLTDDAPDPPDFAVTVARLAGGFDENTVTWNTQPAVLPVPTATAVISESVGSVVTIEITDLVRAQRAGAMPDTISVRIAPSDETPGTDDRFFDFASKEADPAQPAMLIIDLSPNPAPALSGVAWVLALTALAAVGILALRRRRAWDRR